MRLAFARWLTMVLMLGLALGPGAAVAQTGAPALQHIPMKAVLVAGDGSIRVFDNAVTRMQDWLETTLGVPPQAITRLSASPAVVGRSDVQSASLAHVTQAIAHLRPEDGQGCFVFISSHGVHHGGVWLALHEEVLTPAELDRALTAGCGDAPTVAIVSSCYSGGFAHPPMARPNRIVLTAARANRPSFGCDADLTYTFFDECLLGDLDHGPVWRDVFAATRACVSRREHAEDYPASDPQGWFGAAVARLAVR